MKKDIVIAAVAVIVVVALAFGLSAIRPDLPATASLPFGDDSGKADTGGDQVVMRVNGEPVTEREFNLFVALAPEQARGFYASPAGRRALADELVKLKVLEQEAKRLKIGDEPDIQAQLQMTTSQILASRALEKLAESKTEERVRQEYEKEKNSAISLRHILIAYEGGQVPPRGGKQAPTAEAATTKAADLAAKIRAGANFADIARAESDDEQSGQNGGSLGPAKAENLPPDIGAAVSKLQPGQVSEPVKTQFGVHVFKVERPTLDELRPALRQRVRQETAEAEVKRLEDAAKVDLDPKFFPPQREPQGMTPAAPRNVPSPAPKSNG